MDKNVKTQFLYLLQEMVELFHCAVRPSESLGGVSQIAHDESVFPTALPGAGATQVRRGRRSVVDGSQSKTRNRVVKSRAILSSFRVFKTYK